MDTDELLMHTAEIARDDNREIGSRGVAASTTGADMDRSADAILRALDLEDGARSTP
jgi:hypothetical protein